MTEKRDGLSEERLRELERLIADLRNLAPALIRELLALRAENARLLDEWGDHCAEMEEKRDRLGALGLELMKAEAERDAAREALREALGAVAHLPEGVLGHDERSGHPYRNELRDRLRAVLARYDEEKL